MPKPSSTSVRIHWLDSKTVIQTLKSTAQRMKARHPEIEQVILFGSLARGDAVPGSDADLLVILSSSEEPFLERIPTYLPDTLPISIDIFPYTRDELTRLLADGNHFVTQALREGIPLA